LALPPKEPKSPQDVPADKDAAQQDAFLREVDDALRQDDLMRFVRTYGIPILVIVALVLVGFGGYLWWDGKQRRDANERGEKLVYALDELGAGNLKSADSRLAVIAAEDGSASAVSAKLLRAGIALEQKRKKDAIALFAEVAGDKDAPQPYRDLATVRQTAAEFDELDPQQVIDRLKPLAVPGNPWFGVAGELVGIAYLRQEKDDLAGPLFASIARDEDVPSSLRARTRQMAGLLGEDAVDDALQEKANAE